MKINVIKAWKDEEYRSTLSAEQLSDLNNPVESIELSDEQMNHVNGGTIGTMQISINTVQNTSVGCCYLM